MKFWYSVRLYNTTTASKLSDFLSTNNICYRFDYNYLFSIYTDYETASSVDAFIANII